MPKRNYYNPDSEQNLQRGIANAKRKLAEYTVRKEIIDIDRKLEALQEIRKVYPLAADKIYPRAADD